MPASGWRTRRTGALDRLTACASRRRTRPGPAHLERLTRRSHRRRFRGRRHALVGTARPRRGDRSAARAGWRCAPRRTAHRSGGRARGRRGSAALGPALAGAGSRESPMPWPADIRRRTGLNRAAGEIGSKDRQHARRGGGPHLHVADKHVTPQIPHATRIRCLLGSLKHASMDRDPCVLEREHRPRALMIDDS